VERRRLYFIRIATIKTTPTNTLLFLATTF
jgi:hypothetical protein